MTTADFVGYTALGINLYSMTTQVKQLRLYFIVANTLYIFYGILLAAFPIIIGCFIAVCLHTYHLRKPKIL